MEESYTHSCLRRWEEMNNDILVKIFQNLNIVELTSGVSRVCSSWRKAACDPLLWKTLDLSLLRSNFIKTPLKPYIYADTPSDKKFNRVLKIALNLSCGNVSTLIFHYNMYVNDDQLAYTVERCPRLIRLVMPSWNRIKENGICKAIRTWEYLESLTMPSISNPKNIIEEIAKSCKKFSELKIMGPCDILFASTLTEFLPNLKVLSLRCTMLFKDALIMILEGLKGLEVLNISHCVLVEVNPPHAPGEEVLMYLDESILERASGLKKFFVCMGGDLCVMCQRTSNDEGLMRWYRYEEEFWRGDEVRSLAI